jgi:hypothetical protein
MTEETSTAVAEKREPVAYTVVERSLVGNKIYEAGETAMYDGLPAENLAPTCDVGKARYQEYLDTNKVRVAKMIEMHQADASGLGDAASFGKMFLEALAKSNEEHAAQMEAFKAAQADMIAQAVAGAMAAAFPNGVGSPAAWTPKTKGKATKDTAGAADDSIA